MSGRKHYPNSETRAQVEALSSCGIREDEIARFIGVDPKTLRRHYRRELDVGITQSNKEVARSLYEQAVHDKSTSATIFWLKTKAGWREKSEVDVTSNGESVSSSIDVSKLSSEALRELAKASSDDDEQ